MFTQANGEVLLHRRICEKKVTFLLNGSPNGCASAEGEWALSSDTLSKLLIFDVKLKSYFLHGKDTSIVNGLSVLTSFQLSNSDSSFVAFL